MSVNQEKRKEMAKSIRKWLKEEVSRDSGCRLLRKSGLRVTGRDAVSHMSSIGLLGYKDRSGFIVHAPTGDSVDLDADEFRQLYELAEHVTPIDLCSNSRCSLCLEPIEDCADCHINTSDQAVWHHSYCCLRCCSEGCEMSEEYHEEKKREEE